MAESPGSWGELERTIAQALREAHEAQAKGLIGYSTPARIAKALRDAGLAE